MKTFAIVPALNAEKTIEDAVSNLKGVVDEIIVIDDGSVDKTYQLAKDCGIIVLRHIVNRGQGAALQTGNEYALKYGADIVVHFDGDGQHRVEDIEGLVKPILSGEVDVVFGSRFLNKNSNTPWSKKWLILKPAILFNNFITGLKLTDAHNGLRALNRRALKKINITQDRMAHNTEIVSLVHRYKLKYKEALVIIVYNEYGQGIKGGFKILRDLFLKRIL